MSKVSKKRKLVFILKILLPPVFGLLHIIFYYISGFGKNIEEQALRGNANDKYLASIHYLKKDFSKHYRCPSLTPLEEVCYIIFLPFFDRDFTTAQRAEYWLQRSLKQKPEHIKSAFVLAQFYLYEGKIPKLGSGLFIKTKPLPDENYRKAFKLLTKVAEHSQHQETYYLLGWLYLHGLGIKKNETLAIKHLSIAHKLGHSTAGSLLNQEFKKKPISD